MSKRRRVICAIILVLCVSLLASFNRIKLLASSIALGSEQETHNILNRSPEIESIQVYKGGVSRLSLGYATFANPFPEMPQFSIQNLPKVSVDYKTTKIIFQPPYKYGKELYEWHIRQSQEHPNLYVSQEDVREFMFQSDLDPYGYNKKLYTTVPLSFVKKLFMPLGELKNHVLRLKLKSFKDERAYFFERQDKKAICEFGLVTDQEFALVSICWDEKKYIQTFIVKFQGNEEDILDMIKVIISSFEFSQQEIPEKHEALNKLISEELNQQK